MSSSPKKDIETGYVGDAFKDASDQFTRSSLSFKSKLASLTRIVSQLGTIEDSHDLRVTMYAFTVLIVLGTQ